MSKKKAIISAGLIALLCAAVIVGSTFALFAVTRSSDVAVTTGSVDISAELSGLATASLSPEAENVPNETAGKFATGGTAELTGNKLTLTNIVPGDSATFTLTVKNTGKNAAKVRVDALLTLGEDDDKSAEKYIKTTVKNGESEFALGTWACGESGGALILASNETLTLTVTVALDKSATQPADETGAVKPLASSAAVKITVYAGQTNASDSDLNAAFSIN